MTGDELPDDDHLIRYVKPSLVDKDTVDGGAFCLRENEIGLSVNWLEVFGDDKNFQINEVRKLCNFEIRKTGRFAELNVGTTKQYIFENSTITSREIGIVEAPMGSGADSDPSHSEIVGLPPFHSHEAMFVGDLIAECIMYPLHLGKSE